MTELSHTYIRLTGGVAKMKVAYNACFGGFGLSHLALVEYAKRKGFVLTAYSQTKYKHSSGENEYAKDDDPSGMFIYYATKDLGDVISEIPDGLGYYKDFDGSDSRCDDDLIDIIEALGDKANNMFSNLKIKEIPDGVEFEITEYDGNEDVVPPRMTW